MAANTKSTSVIDASFVLNYLFPDEKNQSADQTFTTVAEAKLQLISTTLLPYEVINGLKSAILRKRHPTAKAKTLVKAFQDLPIKLIFPNFSSCLKVSIKHQLSVYDASYLHLAKSKRYPLLTLDSRLKCLAS